jgi:hypothetical protein
VFPLVLERARARLSGADPPPLPDAGNVSEEQLKKIVEHASELKPEEIVKYLGSLGADEILAWTEWLEEVRDGDEGVPEFLRKACGVLVAFTDGETSSMPELTKGSRKFLEASPFGIGMDFADAKRLRQACMDMLAKAEKFSPVSIYVSRDKFGVGVEAICLLPKTVPDKDEKDGREAQIAERYCGSFAKFFDDEEDGSRAVLSLGFGSNTERVHAGFRVDAKGKVSGIKKEGEEDGDDEEPASKEDPKDPKDPFDKISKILSDPGTTYFRIEISLLSRKDHEAFRKMLEEEEEEE